MKRKRVKNLTQIEAEIFDIRKYGRANLIFLKRKEQRNGDIYFIRNIGRYIGKSRNMPFSSKCIVDKEEVLDIIKEIRLKLPDELKQAKWVKEERQKYWYKLKMKQMI